MRLVVDTNRLTFLPIKHPDLYVCANLAWIECFPNQHYLITSLNETFLSGLSDLDKMILYKNTTGETALYVGKKLDNILFEIASRILVREVDHKELEIQASLVPELRSERYLYNPGSTKPAIQSNLFKLDAVKISKSPDENRIAIAAPAIAASAPIQLPATVTAPYPSAASSAAHSAPRQKNIAGVIWVVADQHWQAAGNPTDIKILLALRKDIMNDLEIVYQVKRATSSNELGRWMKTKTQ